MYKTMLVFDNHELLEEIKNLHIWGPLTDFEIASIHFDGLSAYRELKRQRYDLLITEIRITGIDGLQLLRRAKREGFCGHIVLCSEFCEFNYARQGIILGAFDYFVKPMDKTMFISMFSRIKNETDENAAIEIQYEEELMEFFNNRDQGIYTYIPEMLREIYASASDVLVADKIIQNIFQSVIDKVFDENEWFDLFLSPQDFYTLGTLHEKEADSYIKQYESKLKRLFREYCELFPVHNDKIQKVILYILNNPESDLRQKTIAMELNMNCSYLSTIFAAQTEERFVDYLTKVKLKRAGMLLQKTTMTITNIANRLAYRDLGYFSKLFKKQFGMTPSEYRNLDHDYHI